jgi:phytoene dehydrogenase-like protein
MVDSSVLPQDFTTKINHIKPSTFSAMNIAIAVDKVPVYKNGNTCDAMFIEFSPYLDEYRRIFEDYAHGITSVKMPLLAIPTVVDPSRASHGKHTVYIYHYQPYKLRQASPDMWDEIKTDIATKIVEEVKQQIVNLGTENILGSYANRPLPGWGQYRTPIKGLYMCGASTHPGGGVTGGGRAAALAIMEDFGIDFKKSMER